MATTFWLLYYPNLRVTRPVRRDEAHNLESRVRLSGPLSQSWVGEGPGDRAFVCRPGGRVDFRLCSSRTCSRRKDSSSPTPGCARTAKRETRVRATRVLSALTVGGRSETSAPQTSGHLRGLLADRCCRHEHRVGDRQLVMFLLTTSAHPRAGDPCPVCEATLGCQPETAGLPCCYQCRWWPTPEENARLDAAPKERIKLG